ncbi:MAG: hypothetical protein AAF423_09725 [Pseudomonadota bacterium]
MKRVFTIAILMAGLCSTASAQFSETQLNSESCLYYLKNKSLNSDYPLTNVKFINVSGGTRIISWINFDGKAITYSKLNNGSAFTVETYATHPWMISDTNGDCIEVQIAGQKNQIIPVTK